MPSDAQNLAGQLENLINGVVEVTDAKGNFMYFDLSPNNYHRIERIGEEAATLIRAQAAEINYGRRAIEARETAIIGGFSALSTMLETERDHWKVRAEAAEAEAQGLRKALFRLNGALARMWNDTAPKNKRPRAFHILAITAAQRAGSAL